MKGNWLDGQWKPGSGPARVVENPATLDTVAELRDSTQADVDQAVASATAAGEAWAALPAHHRCSLLHNVASKLRQHRGEWSRLLTEETGKPRIEAMDEFGLAASCFDYYAELGRNAYGAAIPPAESEQFNFVIKEPLGTVAAILPFNFPILLLSWKLAPALAAGNSVVIKPAERTPLTVLRVVEQALNELPAGVVNVVTGDATVGRFLAIHPKVDALAFTGSTAVGRELAEQAGRDLKRVNLELGGIDSFIVCDDADLDMAIEGAIWARFLNAGQVCTSAKRIYVTKPVAAEFIERFVERANQLAVGNGLEPATDIGPLISEEAVVRLEDQVARTLDAGAKLRLGGNRLPEVGPGHFYAPTVLTDIPEGAPPNREELFGPVACVYVVDSLDQAIAATNRSEYGLGATVYTRSLSDAMQAAKRLRVGTVWINDPLVDNEAAAFGGVRNSGLGRELGPEGLDAFRETKHIHLDYRASRKRHWFPYTARAKELPEST
jgi:betaine-aldehyde dehydrogenase